MAYYIDAKKLNSTSDGAYNKDVKSTPKTQAPAPVLVKDKTYASYSFAGGQHSAQHVYAATQQQGATYVGAQQQTYAPTGQQQPQQQQQHEATGLEASLARAAADQVEEDWAELFYATVR